MDAQEVIERDSMCSRHIAISSYPEVQGNILGSDVMLQLNQQELNKQDKQELNQQELNQQELNQQDLTFR